MESSSILLLAALSGPSAHPLAAPLRTGVRGRVDRGQRGAQARAELLDLNTGSYGWLRLGQIYDLKRQRNEAIAAYRSTIRYAPGSDSAHQAEDYLSSRYKRQL